MIGLESIPLLVLLYLLTSGMLLYATMHALTLGLLGVQRGVMISLAAMALVISVYQAACAYIISSAEINQVVAGLKIQTTAIYLAFPSFVLFVGLYSRQSRVTIWFALVLLVSTLLCYLTLNEPYSLRYTEITGLRPVTTAWGETIYSVEGAHSRTGQVVHLLGLGMMIWAGYRCYCIWQQQRIATAILFAIYLLFQLLSIWVGWQIDKGDIQGGYVAGFSFMVLIGLMSLSLALDRRKVTESILRKKNQLREEISHRIKIEKFQDRLIQIIDQAPTCIQLLDLSGRVVKANQTSHRFWGRDLSQDMSINLFALLGLQNVDFDEYFSELQPGQQREICVRKFEPEVEVLGLALPQTSWILFQAFPLRDKEGLIGEVVITNQDITALRAAENAIKQISQGVSSSYDNQFFNNLVVTLAELFGARYAFIGLHPELEQRYEVMTHSVCVDGEISDNFSYSLKGTPCAEVAGQSTCVYECGVQGLFPDDHLLQEMGVESYIGSPVTDSQGRAIGILVVLDTKPLRHSSQGQEIMEIFAARAGAELQRLNAEAEIRKMAYEDYLTQLPNRALMHERLSASLRQSLLNNQNAAMVLLDLDHFKAINDSLGHDVGDEVIRSIGHRLRHRLDEEIFLARMGGDEFVLIDSRPTGNIQQQVESLAKQLCKLMAQPIQVGDRLLNVSFSMGIVIYPQQLPTDTPNELDLLRYAEIALYKAKSGGRNQFVIFEPVLQQHVEKRAKIERGLRLALSENHLQLYYQPQVNSEGELIGAEALLRWTDPESGPVSPAVFIPVAEETGLILKIGEWVFDAAFRQIAEWERQGCCPERVSVNVSAWQFAQKGFVSQLLQQLHAVGVSPQRFILELTESALLQDVDVTIRKLKRLREEGFKVSLDDFGTGYSSLAYLKDLPLDELKIDKTFIDELREDGQQPLVESMISIGQHMQLQVVAEGIEQAWQKQRLEKLGCQAYQGYLFARPMPASEFESWAASALCD
ncbi:bifunctional diguanylate cyclase/phosphodiesterase [Neptuniibacter halophilus]|uniref:bifunctional diguanylate cyclase/phosphodiesterase n=1 Tax=Neptuniibacter halophilus TaxID=651666 RepID=UPI002573B84C|nr:EAL domain-containing protein [Neptuniibacter halophilus]